MKENKKYTENIKCPYCEYNNHKVNVQVYGTCTRCRKVLDEKAKFKHDMNIKLKLWRGKLK